MKIVPLGTAGPKVSRIGLGCMGMSGMYGPADRAESIATIHAALDAGINLLDTGDFYGMGHNELLVGEALKGRDRDDVLISVKFGALRGPDNSWNGYDARPAAVKNFLAYSLQRLGTDHIDIYRPARLDPNVPIEETIGAIAEMVKAGYVRHIGLSEVGAETIRRAHAVHPIADLQIEYSLISRGIEDEILPTLPRARHRHHRLWRAVARIDQRPLVEGALEDSRRLPRHGAALPGARTSTAISRWSKRCARLPRQGRYRRAGRDRLGACARRRHRPLRRRAPARSPRRRRSAPWTSRFERRGRRGRSSAPCQRVRPPASATTPHQMAMLDSERKRTAAA